MPRVGFPAASIVNNLLKSQLLDLARTIALVCTYPANLGDPQNFELQSECKTFKGKYAEQRSQGGHGGIVLSAYI